MLTQHNSSFIHKICAGLEKVKQPELHASGLLRLHLTTFSITDTQNILMNIHQYSFPQAFA